MAQMNGVSPEAKAKEIVIEAIKEIMVTIDGVNAQKLDEIVRYRNSKLIYSKGQLWFQKNEDRLRSEFLENIIKGQHDQLQKRNTAAEERDKLEYFKLLLTRGMSKDKALEEAGL